MYNPPKVTKNLRMPIVLIAGGAGFLGSHLAEAFLKQGFRVIVVDDLESGKKDDIAPLLAHPRFGFLEFNLNNGIPAKVESVDAILHLLGEEIYLSSPEDINFDLLLTNSLATYHLLELAKKTGAKFLLASSLNVYQGIISSSNLANYFGLAEDDEKVFSYNEAKRYAESLVWEYYKKFKLDARIVRLPEVYGPRMDLNATSNLGRFLLEAVAGKKLTVYGDGLDKDYYLYIDDAVAGIVASLTKTKTKGKIYSLIDPTPITQLEQAYLVKGLTLPGTEIAFKPPRPNKHTQEIKTVDLKSLKEINFKAKTRLPEGLKITLKYLGLPEKNVSANPPSAPELERLPTRVPAGVFNQKLSEVGSRYFSPRFKLLKLNLPKKIGALYTAAALLLFFSPFILVPATALSLGLTKSYVAYQKVKQQLVQFEIRKAAEAAERLSQGLSQSKDALTSLPLPASLKRPYLKITRSLLFTSKAGHNFLTAVIPLLSQIEALGSDEASPPDYPYLQAENSATLIDNALDNFSLAEAELNDLSLKKLPTLLSVKLDQFNRKISRGKDLTELLKEVIVLTPEALGFDRPKRYLVLLQNSNELRATGGFIGSILRLEVNGGKIASLKIEDIYNLDGKLDEGRLGPPAPKAIKENLKVELLRLRDANFYISFPKSAEKIKSLYQLAGGEAVDGILAIDLEFVKRLLKSLGPVFLSTYNETVNSDNLFEKVQFHSEAGYAAGGGAKKTFLSLLSQKISESLLDLKKSQYLPVLSNLLTALEEKHLLLDFYFPQTGGLADHNFRGEVKDSPGDYLMVVDSNLGANKANYYVKRRVGYEVERGNREGELNSVLTVSYQHKGTSNAWPGGPYKNYLRVLLPIKAALIKAERVDETVANQSGGKETDITAKVEIDEEAGKTSYAILFELQPGEKTSLIFRYVLPPNSFPLAESRYNLLVQKQPGTLSDPFRAKFILPFNANLDENLSQGFTRQGTAVIYEGDLRKDLNLTIPLKN